jgi:hypothetical protein
VSLTKEVQAKILSYVRAGSFDYVAAEASGVSARTFREWMARGEGRHSTRTQSEKLRRFAQDVRTAQAEARVAQEVRVYREQPMYWLSRAARTRPEREGWTEPRAGSQEAGGLPDLGLTEEEVDEQLTRLLWPALQEGGWAVPPCSSPRCRCSHHRKTKRS